VKVVSAGVHHAGHFGSVRQPRRLAYGQRVNIGPEGDDGASFSADYRYKACFEPRIKDFNACFVEYLSYAQRCVKFTVAEFRVTMKPGKITVQFFL